MVERELPPPSVILGGRQATEARTVLAHLGGHQLTILTTVPECALELQTSILGHPGSETAVAHLLVAPHGSDVATERLPPGALHGPVSRSARILDHYARVKEAIEQVTGDAVSLDIDDAALHGYVEIPR